MSKIFEILIGPFTFSHIQGPYTFNPTINPEFQLYYMSSGSQSISDYFSYGCHCNLSGSGHGKAQDEIDSACSRNNGCRKCAQMDFNCSWNSAYFVNGWQQGSENGIVCGK